jgi:hypothetical protein
MKRRLLIKLFAVFAASPFATADEPPIREIYPDTWVATDAIGRTMPDCSVVGPVKTGQRRVVGIFYVTWHTDDHAKLKSPYAADVTKILAADPAARLDAKHPLWSEGTYHWGEPELGYFLSSGYDLHDRHVQEMKPGDLLARHQGVKEEAAVTPAQHSSSLVGKSWTRRRGEPRLNEFDLPVPTFVPWLGKRVEHKLELAIPRKAIGLPDGDALSFDFHWCDNPAELKDPISLCASGDSAPNRRFNFRCIWKK